MYTRLKKTQFIQQLVIKRERKGNTLTQEVKWCCNENTLFFGKGGRIFVLRYEVNQMSQETTREKKLMQQMKNDTK